MEAIQNIFLIGPMGSGKTTIGRQLASRLGMQFYDSDGEIEKKTGADIALIFEIEGEEGFRKREAKMIEELTAKKGILLATGGGAILSDSNRKFLKSRGRVVYLKSSPEKLMDRTAKDKKRPLLNTDDRRATILEMLETRVPLYEEVADLVIQTDNNIIKQIVNRICQQLDLP
ncbi:MAG: shikimate kinase AroK [Gammaproteobacteria bacterium]|nr:shikimate kinase AroK [Gammaproteobacteria bacterium]